MRSAPPSSTLWLPRLQGSKPGGLAYEFNSKNVINPLAGSPTGNSLVTARKSRLLWPGSPKQTSIAILRSRYRQLSARYNDYYLGIQRVRSEGSRGSLQLPQGANVPSRISW
jgi:hypothetical protein